MRALSGVESVTPLSCVEFVVLGWSGDYSCLGGFSSPLDLRKYGTRLTLLRLGGSLNCVNSLRYTLVQCLVRDIVGLLVIFTVACWGSWCVFYWCKGKGKNQNGFCWILGEKNRIVAPVYLELECRGWYTVWEMWHFQSDHVFPTWKSLTKWCVSPVRLGWNFSHLLFSLFEITFDIRDFVIRSH